MGKMIELTAADGHKMAAYRATPDEMRAGKPRGTVVVIQEIFGVNGHIKSVADGYAKDGYLAIAPAMFDRLQRGYDTGYTQPEIQAGIAMMQKLDWKQTFLDVDAAVAEAKKAGKVGIVGYCWGGTVSWRAAARPRASPARCRTTAAACRTSRTRNPKVPTMCNFGARGTRARRRRRQGRSLAGEAPGGAGPLLRRRRSRLQLRPARPYNAEAAKLARERTLAFFASTSASLRRSSR
jgi:carboxymethylenebutenolidase